VIGGTAGNAGKGTIAEKLAPQNDVLQKKITDPLTFILSPMGRGNNCF